MKEKKIEFNGGLHGGFNRGNKLETPFLNRHEMVRNRRKINTAVMLAVIHNRH